MLAHFTRLTNDRHRLAIVRADGSGEAVELETRSFLLHDLAHYVVEAEVPIARGVWGSLAAGVTLAELNGATSADLLLSERLAGPFQSFWSGRLERDRYAEMLVATLGSDAALPRIEERMRRVWGHWRATTFGTTMTLGWP